MNLCNKKIVVTGAGSGIGRATSIELSRDPYVDLILVGRRVEALDETLSLLSHRANHRLLSLDLSQASLVDHALKDYLTEGQLYAIIANAGVAGENHPGKDDRWNEIINTNLTGTYHFLQACIPYLKTATHPWKHIVITSSVLARIGVPYYSAYCASKAGLLGLMRSLAAELAQNRILVNAICPGWVETEMALQGIKQSADKKNISIDDERERQMNFVPLGKMSKPHEVAAVVKFLISNQQTSVTGQAIDLNNGSWMG